MKLLHIMAGAPVGGAETFFKDGVCALAETGKYKQHAMTRNNSPARLKELVAAGVSVTCAGFDKNIYCPTSQKIGRVIKEFQPDIVHHWLARAGSFAVKGPHVNIGWYGGYYDPSYYKNCTHHVAVTRDIADHIVAKGIDAENVHVLHLYAVCEPADPIKRSDFDTPEDVPLLLSLARLHEAKALDILIKAMKNVPGAYLWLAGEGPLEKELKKLAEDLGLKERIKFLGWRNDREALLATADICVFPSRYEPFGAVTIEAWAAGTPIIAAKSQGPKAYIVHEKNGLLVEIDDIEGLKEAIQHLIEYPETGKAMAIEGIKSYKREFTKEAFQKNASGLYEYILKSA